MSEIQKISIALTSEQIGTLKSAVDAGEYATISEVIREAVRDWQRKHKRFLAELRRRRQLLERSMRKSKRRGKKKTSKKRRSRQRKSRR